MWIRNIGRQNKDTKEIETQNRVRRATQFVLNSFVFVFHMLMYPNPKGGKPAKDCFTMIQRTNRTIMPSIPGTLSNCILS